MRGSKTPGLEKAILKAIKSGVQTIPGVQAKCEKRLHQRLSYSTVSTAVRRLREQGKLDVYEEVTPFEYSVRE